MDCGTSHATPFDHAATLTQPRNTKHIHAKTGFIAKPPCTSSLKAIVIRQNEIAPMLAMNETIVPHVKWVPGSALRAAPK
jgi:hypothetical protein